MVTQRMSTLRESLAYQPVELAFGTSGLRGLVTDITDLEAYINTRGFLAWMLKRERSAGGCVPGDRVLLAGDLRPSTDSTEHSILRAVARAANDSGLTPQSLGAVPTPCLVLTALRAACPSIMITGSHIPFDRNGIKFHRADGEVLKSDEAEILAAVSRVRSEIYSWDAARTPFDTRGMLRPGESPSPALAAEDAVSAWRTRWRSVFPAADFAGRRIVVYQHSAVGRDLLVTVLSDLGAEVLPAGRSDVFVPVDTEDIGPIVIAKLRALVRDAVAMHGRVDAIVSTDGDSDRPLVGAVVEGADGPDVQVVGGDLLGLLVAEYLDADAACVPVSANDAVDRRLGERGVSVRKTRIGSPYVIAAMAALKADHPEKTRLVAWESNGGFLVGRDMALNGDVLPALPTRDAFLPILAALHAAFRSGRSLASLLDDLPRRFSKAGLIDQFSVTASRRIIGRFSLPDGIVEATFRDGEPVAITREDGAVVAPFHDEEDSNRRAWEALTKLAAEIESVLATVGLGHTSVGHTRVGQARLGRLERVNTLDGVRLWCESGEIIHLRPSGNAPQMRVYAVADTPERAAELVAEGIREPDGLLRRLEAAL